MSETSGGSGQRLLAGEKRCSEERTYRQPPPYLPHESGDEPIPPLRATETSGADSGQKQGRFAEQRQAAMERDEWDFAISMASGDVVEAAKLLGIQGPRGTRSRLAPPTEAGRNAMRIDGKDRLDASANLHLSLPVSGSVAARCGQYPPPMSSKRPPTHTASSVRTNALA